MIAIIVIIVEDSKEGTTILVGVAGNIVAKHRDWEHMGYKATGAVGIADGCYSLHMAAEVLG